MTAEKLRIAGVQMDVRLGDVAANLEQLIIHWRTATAAGARLTVFPECVLSGYCFESLAEALEYGLTIDSPPFQRLIAVSQELGSHVEFGFLETAGDQLYNSAVCLGPSGVVARYRKIHLPFLGVDRFTTAGNELSVFALPGHDLRLAMNICYDCSFPEAARVLMLQGADLLVLPTNWPPTSGLTADVIPNARALENNLYVLTVNRVGSERGFSFIGKSKLCNPGGGTLAFANHAEEEIIYGEIDPAWARRKHLVNIPGQHEVHRVRDRRPECYGPLCHPKDGSLL
ncbi:MAG: carbon-nitrogen hydrolase family protein [Planctomycetota bacterium]